ncbi:MAG: hypothetical protein ACOX3P_00865 [Saccharofermentanales bacterium]|nr:hypothetical protein [Bacillota bacterium]NLB08202.1 hypothetical protein [Clostridiales bacterium]
MVKKEVLIEYIEMLKDACEAKDDASTLTEFDFGRKMGHISALVKLKDVLDANDIDPAMVGLNFDIEKKYLPENL